MIQQGTLFQAFFFLFNRKFGRHVVVRTCNGSELRETIPGDSGEYMRRPARAAASSYGATRYCPLPTSISSARFHFFLFFVCVGVKWMERIVEPRRRISAAFTDSRHDAIRLLCEKTPCRQRRHRSVRRPVEFQFQVAATISATSVRAECIRLNARPTCIVPVSASVSSPNTRASKRNLSEYVILF